MLTSVGTVLLLLCALQIKHMFADYYMQTPKMLSGRGEYLHMGRAQHAGIHAIGSFLVLVLFGAPFLFSLVLAGIEWVVHFNIDYCKARYSDAKQYTPTQAGFWRAAGTDQAAHHLTYIAMVWAWVVYTG
ncbi:DUF3307 domain-containing protein [Aliisedimentitalea scapharcae]|uniref:DUF3307 domain-containing protein n=1 Tax=Aliisedimentitalea scapharcae TaxID=1524259 RepID=A0ABZ2XXX7_9RHOB